MAMQYETAWEFATANFRVALEIAPEEMDPADSFQFDDDIEAVRSGAVEWFCAKLAVYGPTGDEIAADYLGGCAYSSVREFYTSHRDPDPGNRNTLAMKAQNRAIGHYFPDMVAQAISLARAEFKRQQSAVCGIKLRA